MTEVIKGRYYPMLPPMISDSESIEQYIDRLTGGQGEDLVPYDHVRLPHCAVGRHNECPENDTVDADGAERVCECPHHVEDPDGPDELDRDTAIEIARAIIKDKLYDAVRQGLSMDDAVDVAAEAVIDALFQED